MCNNLWYLNKWHLLHFSTWPSGVVGQTGNHKSPSYRQANRFKDAIIVYTAEFTFTLQRGWLLSGFICRVHYIASIKATQDKTKGSNLVVSRLVEWFKIPSRHSSFWILKQQNIQVCVITQNETSKRWPRHMENSVFLFPYGNKATERNQAMGFCW